MHQSQSRHGAAPQALFGHKVQTRRAAARRAAAANRLPQQSDARGSSAPVFARKGLQQFALAIARHPGQAHDLARPHLQLDALQIHAEMIARGQRQIVHAQHHLTRPLRARRQGRWLGANHHAAERGIAFVARVAIARHTACTQHRALVAQGANFVQLVADIQNAAPFGCQLPQHGKKTLHRLRRQHRGGLIQNQQARIGQQGADDFHALHLAHAQRVHQPLRVDGQVVGGRLFGHHLCHFRQGMARLQAQPHVLRHAQRLEYIEVLKHHGYAQRARLLRIGHAHDAPVHGDGAAIGLGGTVDDLHQGGFARAVFAQHRVDFTGLHQQIDRVISHHAGIGLGNARQLQAGWCGRHGQKQRCAGWAGLAPN